MDDILNELNTIFRIVSSIPVTGDAVDSMAAVRAKLRKVYADIEASNKTSNEASEVSHE